MWMRMGMKWAGVLTSKSRCSSILPDLWFGVIWGNLISVDDSPTWIPFKYERLLNFCFKCGIIKHALSGCEKRIRLNDIHDPASDQYGAWLWASSAKILWKSQAQKSHSRSSSFEKHKSYDEEETLANNARGEDLENFESRNQFIIEEELLAPNCFDNHIKLTGIPPPKDTAFPLPCLQLKEKHKVQKLGQEIDLANSQPVIELVPLEEGLDMSMQVEGVYPLFPKPLQANKRIPQLNVILDGRDVPVIVLTHFLVVIHWLQQQRRDQW